MAKSKKKIQEKLQEKFKELNGTNIQILVNGDLFAEIETDGNPDCANCVAIALFSLAEDIIENFDGECGSEGGDGEISLEGE